MNEEVRDRSRARARASAGASCRPTASGCATPPGPRARRTRAAPGMRARIVGVGEAEVAAVDEQVLGDGEVGVEVVELRHDADRAPRAARARRGTGSPISSIVPPSGSISPRQSRSVVVLPAPFGPSRPKHSPRADRRATRRRRPRRRRSACAGPATRRTRRRGQASPLALDDVAQQVQPPVEEVVRARHDDHRQLLRPRPVEHVRERHGLVELAVDHDRVGRHGARAR